MKVALVESYNPAAHLGKTVEPVIPAGLLSLAAMLEDKIPCIPEIIPLNLLIENGVIAKNETFPHEVATYLKQLNADVVGLQTLCNSYHVALQIAQEYRKLRPDAIIVLGGPQASATDIDTLKAFEEIDIIFRGEAENSFLAFMNCLHRGDDWSHIPGITFKHNDAIRQNPPDKMPVNLDELPQPAYHLYPIASFDSIQIDSARGCPNKCIYCSTSAYFHRRIRTKSPARILKEMEYIFSHYGIRHFHMTHDVFGVNRDHAIEFCQLLSKANLGITWQCMARIDLLDKELLDLMICSGLRDVYFGIESGSPNIQKYTNKNLKLDLAQHNLNNVRRSDINYTCSFVVGFSEETSSDLNQTIDLALRCTGTNGTVQVNTVKPYAGSELYSIFQGNICFNDYSLMLDNTLDNDSLRLIKRHPSLFSAFYSMPSQFNINILNLFQVINSHDVLLKAIFSEFENPLTFFTHWHEWRVERNHQSSTPSTFKELGVQCNAFIKHLIDKHYLKIEFTPDLLDYFNTSYDWEFDTLSSPDTASIPSFHDLSTQPRSWIPSVGSHVVLKEFNYDVSSLFDVIENDAVPASYPREKHWVAFIAARVGEETSIYTRELDERSIRILNLADENKSIEDIIHISSESTPSIIEILRLFADCTIVEFRKNAQ